MPIRGHDLAAEKFAELVKTGSQIAEVQNLYYCCGITDKGAVCESNEDAYLINKLVLSQAQMESEINSPFIAAVADGVGGEAAGEIASHMALELLSSVKFGRRADLRSKIMTIHSKLKRYGMTHDRTANMQTTLCAIAVNENGRAFVINVGDSRMYRFRGGKLRQISTDQSLVQLLYENGRISKDEKKKHSHRNIIFPVLGNIADDPSPEIREIDGGIKRGEVIVICTDGLWEYITTGEFEEILSLPMHLSKRLKRLIDAAVKNGSPDNVTVVGISVI